MKNLINYISETYGEELVKHLVKIEQNGELNCIFFRWDTDVFLSQITFWKNLAYTAEIMTISDEKYHLNENEILTNETQQQAKFQQFMGIVQKITK